MKKMAIALMFVALIAIPSLRAHSASSLQIVAEDAGWGALIGTLAGGAVLAFTDKPQDHWDYLLRGAAVGAFVGIGFGIYEIHPIFTAYRTPDNKETAYGLKLYIPLK